MLIYFGGPRKYFLNNGSILFWLLLLLLLCTIWFFFSFRERSTTENSIYLFKFYSTAPQLFAGWGFFHMPLMDSWSKKPLFLLILNANDFGTFSLLMVSARARWAIFLFWRAWKKQPKLKYARQGGKIIHCVDGHEYKCFLLLKTQLHEQ